MVIGLGDTLGDHLRCRACWTAMKTAYAGLAAARADQELARTFFNSATRRVFATVGIDPEIEFVEPMPAGSRTRARRRTRAMRTAARRRR